MSNCPLYNGKNLNFTGDQNPYGLIQNGGKSKSGRTKKTMYKRRNKKIGRKTRKYRR